MFTPLAPEMLRDPYPRYAELRREAPVQWFEPLRAWLVLRHADCTRVVTDSTTFSNDLAVLGEDPPTEILGLQNLDPPEHTSVRHALVRALKSVDVGVWARESAGHAERLLADADLNGFDFVSEFAEPLSAESMRILFGVPDFGAPDEFHAAQRALVLSMDAGLEPERGAPGVRARDHLSGVLEPWVMRPPKNGLLSGVDIASAGRLRRYLVNSLRQILVAGFSSSSSMLGLALKTLIEQGLLDRDEPLAVTPTVYNEVVRHSGAVQVDSRACAQDVELGGQLIRRGDEVVAVIAAANRDPDVFERPDDLVVDRSPNPHLGFGRGVHSCLGTALATVLHAQVLTTLSERYRVRLSGTPVMRPTATLHGLDRLPVALLPR
uniref:Putative cytochrome P450 n=1 Tax=Planomonospora sp. TaxID=2028102 RepID=A0A891LYB2_9ACTN|nr:putative cytochrome P450 [Planomonospora sp.]